MIKELINVNKVDSKYILVVRGPEFESDISFEN